MIFKKKDDRSETEKCEVDFFKLASLQNIKKEIKHEKRDKFMFNLISVFMITVWIFLLCTGVYHIYSHSGVVGGFSMASDIILIAICTVAIIWDLVNTYQYNKIEKSILNRLNEIKDEINGDDFQ